VPLWAKPGATIDHGAMSFMSRDDVVLDRELFVFDIRATKAHVNGLHSTDLLTESETTDISDALDELARRFIEGSFVLDERYEDGHTAIESYLVEQLGETGKRVHLGRSRNDQVAVALRLYMLDALDTVKCLCLDIARAALGVARRHEFDPMPGYTHLQRAVPSSIGLWMGSFVEGFLDAAELCALTRRWIDASPLGTAAGYGVNIELPRQQVSDELGFARLQLNPMAAQASRGRIEHQVVSTLWQAMQEVRRLAWDCSLFSTREFGFVTLAPEFVTGSSIMPNKANPDMAELLRASTAIIGGALSEIQQSMSLPSGYQRDLQITKPALIRAVNVTREALSHIPNMITSATYHTDAMRTAIEPAMLATDRAVELATSGLPFRDAYKQAASEIDSLELTDEAIDASLRDRRSPGACGNLLLDAMETRLAAACAD
jgi:argininosuccinate lyase